MTETQIKKSILILRSKPNTTSGAETFLRNREWTVHSTTNLKEFLTLIIQKKPSFVMLSVDHTHKKIKMMPTILTQSFPVCVITFAESSSTVSFRKLQETNCEYRVNPPATGPAIERAVNKYLKDLERKSKGEPTKEGATGEMDGKSGSDTVAIKGDKTTNSTTIHGGGISGGSEEKAWGASSSLLSQLMDNDDSSSGAAGTSDNGAAGFAGGHTKAGTGAFVAHGDNKEGGGFWAPGEAGAAQNQGAAGNITYNEDDFGGARIDHRGQFDSFGNPVAMPMGGFDSKGNPQPGGGYDKDGNPVAMGGFDSQGNPQAGGGFNKEGKPVAMGGFDSKGNPQAGGSYDAEGNPTYMGAYDANGKPQAGGGFDKDGQPLQFRKNDPRKPISKEQAGEAENAFDGRLEKPQKKIDPNVKVVTQMGRNTNSDMESIILKGTKQALTESVEVNDGLIDQEIEDSSQVACIVVESERFTGYLIAAMGKNRKMDGKFIKTIQDKLFKFLKDNGENISEKDNMNLKIKKVEFQDWAVEYADFLKKSVHNGEEIAMAFFPVNNVRPEVSESAASTMAAVKLKDIDGDKTVDFNVYVYLPANKKYILYTPKGSKLYGNQKERLETKGVKEVHMLKSEVNDLTKYKAQNYLNNLIESYEAKKKVSKAS